MVSSGSLAMIVWKPGQARKGAAVPKDSCAEMWLELATQFPTSTLFLLSVWDSLPSTLSRYLPREKHSSPSVYVPT